MTWFGRKFFGVGEAAGTRNETQPNPSDVGSEDEKTDEGFEARINRLLLQLNRTKQVNCLSSFWGKLVDLGEKGEPRWGIVLVLSEGLHHPKDLVVRIPFFAEDKDLKWAKWPVSETIKCLIRDQRRTLELVGDWEADANEYLKDVLEASGNRRAGDQADVLSHGFKLLSLTLSQSWHDIGTDALKPALKKIESYVDKLSRDTKTYTIAFIVIDVKKDAEKDETVKGAVDSISDPRRVLLISDLQYLVFDDFQKWFDKNNKFISNLLKANEHVLENIRDESFHVLGRETEYKISVNHAKVHLRKALKSLSTAGTGTPA